MPLVQLDGVRVHRGSFRLAVDRWSLEPGQVVGLVGPNGAGKSTLLQLLHGLFPPAAGRVEVVGVDPFADPVTARTLTGFASDDAALFDLPTHTLL